MNDQSLIRVASVSKYRRVCAVICSVKQVLCQVFMVAPRTLWCGLFVFM